MNQVKLLDCTLRDGGYLNNWNFGHDNIVNIYERLISSQVDIVEVGFMNQTYPADMNCTIQPDSEHLDAIFAGLKKRETLVVGMIDYGTCSIDNISSCKESYLDGIRVIFKKQKRKEAIDFCRQIKEKGYLVFTQAVSITSYQDEELMELLEMVNELQPYAFSLVDTYGLLHKNQLMHYFEMADRHLLPEIGLGYHSHNNFQLAYANCIELIEKNIDRMLLIDGSLYGMGKSAGNAPIELLATYLNDSGRGNYKVYHLMEAIDTTILDIWKEVQWGYSFKFFLSASNDCHPNYVSYLIEKKKLSVKSINMILKKIDEEKKLNYNQDHIEKLYIDFQKRDCDDKEDYHKIESLFDGKTILLIGPGQSINQKRKEINNFIVENNPVVISVNFIPEEIPVHYVFISNAKRYVQISTQIASCKEKIIATSNVTSTDESFSYQFCYSDLLDEKAMIVDNPMIMFMRLLKQLRIEELVLAGFDGYVEAESANYVNPNMEHTFSREKAKEINRDVIESIQRLEVEYPYRYLTKSLYEQV